MDALAKPRVEAAPQVLATSTVAPREVTAGEKMNVDQFMTYSLDHDIPFVADYYGVGDMLGFQDLPYKAEVDLIDNYLVSEVKAKRLDNTTDAVKARLKQLEKIAGIESYLPTAQRTKTLAAYVKYLGEMEAIGQPLVFA